MLLGIIFLYSEPMKTHILRDEMMIMHCWLYIKQNIYSIGFFHAPVVIQYIVKVERKIKKVPFLKVYHFSISQHFPNVKMVVLQAVIA